MRHWRLALGPTGLLIHSKHAWRGLPAARVAAKLQVCRGAPANAALAGPSMLRGAGEKQPLSGRAARGNTVRRHAGKSTYPLGQRAVYEGRTAATKAVGFCSFVLAGGAALFAIWELCNFSVTIGNAPLLPAAVRQSQPPGAYRPAGDDRNGDGGCTQAPIDRSSGQTTPTDCHTWAFGRETMVALLSGRRSKP